MKSLLVAVALVAAPTLASAQPADAIGQPLAAADLGAGTVSVRVIAGDMSAAVAGTDVTLLVDGAPRTARTQSDGRALFSGVPAGAKVQATIAGEQGEVASAEFQLPADTGVKLMLTTKPMTAAAGPTGAPGMPQPRQMSGWPRPEPADPAGTLVVRLTHDNLQDPNPPKNIPVTLFGYKHDDSVTVVSKNSDETGRATFTKLDINGDYAYYAVALLPRDNGVDRLVSQPIQMLPGVGMRLLLSGARRDSTEASFDGYGTIEQQMPNVPAGRIAVAIVSDKADEGGTVELVHAGTGKVIATQPLPATEEAWDPAKGRFGDFEPDDRVAVGSLRVIALAGPQAGALVGAKVALTPLQAGVEAPVPATTDENGSAVVTGVGPGQYRVVIATDDRQIQSDPITVPPDKGGRVIAAMEWFEGIPPRVLNILSVPSTPEPLYVRVNVKGSVARNGLPFLPAPDHGHTSVFDLGQRIRFGFELTGSVDDKYYAVSGQFSLYNMTWAPYRAGEDGLVIPLPHDFVGGVLAEEDKQRVTPEPDAGFRIRRPLPPGPFQFQGGFSLPIDDGTAKWRMDLPWGAALNSELAFIHTDGMTVDVHGNAHGRDDVAPNGTRFFHVENIVIAAGQSMSLDVKGLPMAAAWKVWLPRLAGAVVIALLGLTLWLVVRARKAPLSGVRAAAAARIQTLMDELVDLETKGVGGKRRDQLLAELEKLWEADGRNRAA
jgi:hypothetical protein